MTHPATDVATYVATYVPTGEPAYATREFFDTVLEGDDAAAVAAFVRALRDALPARPAPEPTYLGAIVATPSGVAIRTDHGDRPWYSPATRSLRSWRDLTNPRPLSNAEREAIGAAVPIPNVEAFTGAVVAAWRDKRERPLTTHQSDVRDAVLDTLRAWSE